MTAFLHAGEFRHRLALEIGEPVSDGFGGNDPVWQFVAHVWARIEPMGSEFLAYAAGSQIRITHRIHIRHRSGISGRNRFVLDGRIFAIRAVHDPDETGRYLVCECEELK